MDASLSVIRSTPTEDAVWEAVSEAVTEGWTVARFRRECAEAWQYALQEEAEAAEREWAK